MSANTYPTNTPFSSLIIGGPVVTRMSASSPSGTAAAGCRHCSMKSGEFVNAPIAGAACAVDADDEPDRVAGSLGGEAVFGEYPRGFGCLRKGEADQQVFHTADSEIGVAFKAGHPCYFIGFLPDPISGQTIEDVARSEAVFIERVIARRS